MSKYLDNNGLLYLWTKIKAALAGKQNTIIPGDGLSKDGDTLSVDTPVRGIYTQPEFDVLTEVQKASGTYFVKDGADGGGDSIKIVSDGKALEIPLGGLRGPAGPDGCPIGTIISYMGLTAPMDYLVCDGSTYSISDYHGLSDFFKNQFGSVNYFGGDGESTFAVPDLRNLFLRGYHGEAGALSGAIGQRQDGTVHTAIHGMQADNGNYAIWTASKGQLSGDLSIHTENADTEGMQDEAMCVGAALVGQIRETSAASYTARPVNAAVLYCIKAVGSAPSQALFAAAPQSAAAVTLDAEMKPEEV